MALNSLHCFVQYSHKLSDRANMLGCFNELRLLHYLWFLVRPLTTFENQNQITSSLSPSERLCQILKKKKEKRNSLRLLLIYCVHKNGMDELMDNPKT